ncbi:MAG: DUF1343 domain-containing protein [Pseudomonadota bacterium]
MVRTKTGLEVFSRSPLKRLKGKRLGLLANPASVTPDFCHASGILSRIYPGQLKALFSPQHGFYAQKQDNMIESDHSWDKALDIPVFSLYSSVRKPCTEMLDTIDTLIIDLQDAGTRVYTFIYTISLCLEAAAAMGKEIIVLDRPNPVGGTAVEGNLLDMAYSSFVGRYPIPMRHGLTVGEISRLFNTRYGIHADLTVIPMQGWQRQMLFHDTGLPWIAPSPNLPTAASTIVYPGQVIFEGTNVSEGRGTTQPFEIFGAPFLETDLILEAVRNRTPGMVLRPLCFEPTSNKWQLQACHGFQMHVTDALVFRPYKTSLLLLQAIVKYHSDQFQWKQPPYEYDFHNLPIDLILGSRTLRERIGAMEDLDDLEKEWQKDCLDFQQISRGIWLYD